MRNYFFLAILLLSFGRLSAQCEFVNPDCTILSDFECQTNYVGLPAVTNPAPDAVNSSPLVGEYFDQNDPYDALILDLGGPIDLSVFNELHIKVFTTAAPTGRLLAILEGGTSTRRELAVASITSGAWTEYVFDFSGEAAENHTRVVFILNADVTRTSGPELYYLDDIRWVAPTGGADPCAGTVADPNIINDFECQQNEPFQVCFPIIANPVPDADNSSPRVGCYKDVGGEFANIFIQYDGAIDLTTNNQFMMKVNTAVPGNLLVKLEGGTVTFSEKNFAIVGDGSWEQVTIDFSDEATADHTRLVLFFNSGNIPGADDKYFIDDLIWTAAPFPVDLYQFSAAANKEDVSLSWETASETGTDRFVVEHKSQTTDDWLEVGEVPAVGESSSLTPYDFLHRRAGSGTHLYRLRMEDLDGSHSYSPIRSVVLEGSDAMLSVYPNPIAEDFTLSVTADLAEPATTYLTDMTGRVLLTVPTMLEEGRNQIPLVMPQGLPHGTYLVKLVQRNGTQSVMVAH